MIRAHVYASDQDARAAVETIDKARPQTEVLTTIIGPRGLTRLVDAGMVTVGRDGTIKVTARGVAEGITLGRDGLQQVREAPAKTWTPTVELSDGTVAVPVCSEVSGRQVDVRGELRTVPPDETARVISKAEVKPDATPKAIDLKDEVIKR